VLQAKKTIDFGFLAVGGPVGLVGRAGKAGLDTASGSQPPTCCSPSAIIRKFTNSCKTTEMPRTSCLVCLKQLYGMVR